MSHFYKNVYTSLRSAMIDRNQGDKVEDAKLVDFVAGQIALKPEIPSAALLISYSMLYYPGWLNDGTNTDYGLVPVSHTIEDFLGGVENPKFPLLFNVHMGMIAMAVGIYAGLWKVSYSQVLQTILIAPNMESPLVKETAARIKKDQLTFTDARDVFIELMQQEEYKGDIALADDYVANATFIAEAGASVDDDATAKIEEAIQVDFSKDFGKVMNGGKH
jgi:hypothetical protein